MSGPRGIAAAADGTLFVVDLGNNRIQHFDPTGVFLDEWGIPGSGPGELFVELAVALDSADNVYVAGATLARVQKFDSAGNFLQLFEVPAQDSNQFLGLAVDATGNVFVSEANRSKVVKLAADGTVTAQWGSPVVGPGELYVPHDVALDPSGNVYVLDLAGKVAKYAPDGSGVVDWGSSPTSPGGFSEAIATDSLGNVYVTDLSDSIQKFDTNGQFLMQWGSNGSGSGELFLPSGIAVDTVDQVWVLDRGNSRVQVFDTSGTFQSQWPIGTSSGNGLAIGPSGNIYLVSSSDIVWKYSPAGNLLTTWGNTGTGQGEFLSLSDLVVDRHERVYVSDGSRIQQFDSNGTLLDEFSIALADFRGMALSPGGIVHVTERRSRTVMRLGCTQLDTWFQDMDGDGFGSDAVQLVQCDQPIGFVPFGADCDDFQSLANPGATEVCDGLDNDCDGAADEEFPGWGFRCDAGVCGQFLCEQGSVTCVPLVSLPPGPTGLLADSSGADVVLTWNTQVGTVLSWNVYRATVPDPVVWEPAEARMITDANGIAPGVQFVDEDARLAVESFFYLITANDACGESLL